MTNGRLPAFLSAMGMLMASAATLTAQQPDPVPALDASKEGVSTLPGTNPLFEEGDLAAKMVAGIDAWLDHALAASPSQRARHWQRDYSSHEAYDASVEPNRERFKHIIGLMDERVPVVMEHVGAVDKPAQTASGPNYTVTAVRWPVLEGVHGEGLLLQPDGEARTSVVAVPDCDWTPEMLAGLEDGIPPASQFARRLVENGCEVLVPVLLNRDSTYSGVPAIRMTDQSHREFIYRPAFEMGRHIIGYEVQKILAGVDWFEQQGAQRIGVIGYGEGGLLAMYAAAVDTRIDAAVVSGYFSPREEVWSEPVCRNVWALLDEFGDAGIASLIVPRTLIVDAAPGPVLDGGFPQPGKQAAPGKLVAASAEAVTQEVGLANALVADLQPPAEVSLLVPDDQLPGGDSTLRAFLQALGVEAPLVPSQATPQPADDTQPDSAARMKRQFDELLAHTQAAMRQGPERREIFWEKADRANADTWAASAAWYREYFHTEILGKLPELVMPANARTRLVIDDPAYTGYEVMLDVYEDVFAYGLLLVPKDLKPGERRPVVVCQHGLEGRPSDVADPSVESHFYHQFGCRLAEEGFVVFAPQNPYIGGTDFRQLQRKANPLKLSLFSFIVRQHEVIVDWLAAQAFVDPSRIAFYGLSYGGKTAMRVPPLVDKYYAVICSGDYNQWIWKMVSIEQPFTYPFTHEYEMYEFDLGNTFNYGELSWLIFPRPFMVERGHDDGVSIDEWVACEYARTRRFYNKLGHGDKTCIEYFDGPHEIHGEGTFAFLRGQLDHPR